VKEITPKVDRAKATVMVRVEFVDDMAGVLPEMSARVSFLSAELDLDAVKEPPKKIVPESAVTERAGGKVVFVIEGDQVRMMPVKLGASFAGGFEVIQGPRAGTRLVKSPPATLADGQRVKEKT
jgi:multidrug efflux pump subunit AcrA (membrane-fusion protein)